MKKKLIVLTGAGISAESGISTFRDAGGLWEGHDIMEVASPEGFAKNPALVLDFYNKRRAQLNEVKPNLGHKTLVDLEQYFDVHIITQNVDDLHERAGSSNIIHLHGELRKVRSVKDERLIKEELGSINLGDLAEDGGQLRPHIVWFGEAVPAMEEAMPLALHADIFIVVGTSLAVYPAAGLVNYCKPNTPIIVVDPGQPEIDTNRVHFVQKTACEGLPEVMEILVKNYS